MISWFVINHSFVMRAYANVSWFVYLILVNRNLCNPSYIIICALVRHVHIIWHMFKSSVVIRSRTVVSCDRQGTRVECNYWSVSRIYIYCVYAENKISQTILLVETSSKNYLPTLFGLFYTVLLPLFADST